MHQTKHLVNYARTAYLDGRIEVEELEAALDHIHAGGLGNPRFPYLPAFEMPAREPARPGGNMERR
jgi:hypothetical protein